jgi:hypothetical protein
MANKPVPFAAPRPTPTHGDPLDWHWVEEAPPQGQTPAPARQPSRGFDVIPGDTFRAAGAGR